jgi:hypothetical protein
MVVVVVVAVVAVVVVVVVVVVVEGIAGMMIDFADEPMKGMGLSHTASSLFRYGTSAVAVTAEYDGAARAVAAAAVAVVVEAVVVVENNNESAHDTAVADAVAVERIADTTCDFARRHDCLKPLQPWENKACVACQKVDMVADVAGTVVGRAVVVVVAVAVGKSGIVCRPASVAPALNVG